MSETRPRLMAVPGEGSPAGAPARRETRRPGAFGRGPWLPLALGVAVAICAMGWYLAAGEAAKLRIRLGASEAALAQSREDLGRAERRRAAFAGHVDAAREQIADLAQRIGALDAFLASDPAGEAAAEAPQP